MEAHGIYSNRRYMGGSYSYNGLERPACNRNSAYPSNKAGVLGTRPILYIK